MKITMKRKRLAVGVGLGVGAAMLFVSGFSAMANTSGYDTYKTALQNMKAEQSLTENAELMVTDNGTKVFSGTANIKLNHEQKDGSAAVTLADNSITRTLNVFHQDGRVIFKSSDNDIYRVMQQDSSKLQHDGDMQGPPKAVGEAIDTLIGNLRERVMVENESDGSRQASLHLSDNQIPAAVNALGSLIISHAANSNQGWHGNWNDSNNAPFAPADMKLNLPKLTENLKVNQINLDATINPDNLIKQQTAEIIITGKDSTGENHILKIQLHVDFSGFNQTTPDQIDLTGKQTLAIQNDWNTHGWHR